MRDDSFSCPREIDASNRRRNRPIEDALAFRAHPAECLKNAELCLISGRRRTPEVPLQRTLPHDHCDSRFDVLPRKPIEFSEIARLGGAVFFALDPAAMTIELGSEANAPFARSILV
jgi:hypothetical protein